MPLILHHLTPIHWAAAGAGIAAVTLALLFVANRRLGISTGLEDLCSFVLPVPYFARDAVRSARQWRMLSGSGNTLLLRGCGALPGTCRACTQVLVWPTASSNRCEAPW